MTARCAVCGSDSPRPKHRKHGVAILACRDCGLAFWLPPEDFRPRAVYDEAYFADARAGRGYDDYQALEPVLRRNFARRLARIPAPRPGARALDLGAAFGFGVAEAASAGWSAVGVEIAAAAAARAERTVPGRVVVARAAATPFAAASFDLVTLWDVLEHLPDPHAAIAEVARLLRPGGRLVLTTGDVGSLAARLSGAHWHLFTLPEHLFFYTRRSLQQLLSAHGFRVESQRAEASLYPLGYLIERLRKSVWGSTRETPATWPGARFAFPLNLFDIVTVHAVLAASR